MAYKGLAYPVFAPVLSERARKISYKAGGYIGRAMEYEFDPTYVDVSDYSDMNDLNPAEEFAFADITLKTAETNREFDMDVLGAKQGIEGLTIMNGLEAQNILIPEVLTRIDINKKSMIGLGLLRPKRYKGTTSWILTWLYKVYILGVKDSTETKGKDINYSTPEISMRAIPAENGNWKKDMTFRSLAEARTYLEYIANNNTSQI